MGTFKIRKTTEQFISDARLLHGDKYDYSKVVYKTNKEKVCIIDPVLGEFWQRPIDHLRKKKSHQVNKPLSTKSIIDVKLYKKWLGMKIRCSPKNWELNKYKSYEGCSCFEDWNIYENFKKWALLTENGYILGYHLDKDILFKGNKVYSPSTCCFVPQEINNLLTNCRRARGKYPIGVAKNRNMFDVHLCCYGVNSCIGTYDTPIKAFNAYKTAKEKYIKELAKKYFQEGKITEKVYNALMKYEVEITD
jgi:hypothetical protein